MNRLISLDLRRTLSWVFSLRSPKGYVGRHKFGPRSVSFFTSEIKAISSSEIPFEGAEGYTFTGILFERSGAMKPFRGQSFIVTSGVRKYYVLLSSHFSAQPHYWEPTLT